MVWVKLRYGSLNAGIAEGVGVGVGVVALLLTSIVNQATQQTQFI